MNEIKGAPELSSLELKYEQSELERLRAALRVARDALEFYASELSWATQDIYHEAGLIGTIDMSEVGDDYCGGKTAREALEKIDTLERGGKDE